MPQSYKRYGRVTQVEQCIPCVQQAQRYVGVPGLYGVKGLRGLGASGDANYGCHDGGGSMVDGKCVRVFEPGGRAIFEANCRKRGGTLVTKTENGASYTYCAMPDGQSFLINDEQISSYPVVSHYDNKAPKKYKRPGKLGAVTAVVGLYFLTSFIYGKVAAA